MDDRLNPIESGDIHINQLMEVPVLGAPLRADFENKLNPYDKMGSSMDEEVSTAKVKGSQRKRTLET